VKNNPGEKVLISGNHAIAEAAIRAGCRASFGYPITPQNELIGYMAVEMPRHKRIFIQAESELAAINMVYGAAAAGARAMTSSSSPGISLKQEGISYMAGAELPGVVVNIVRGGPGLGNIAAAQSDYFQSTRGGGHGDYRTIVMAPAAVQEAADLTILAFDLADKYRMPVLVLGDAIIGQMKEPVMFPPYRDSATLPRQAWAVGPSAGRAPRVVTSIYLGDGELEKKNRDLEQKYRTIEKNEVRYEETDVRNARVVMVAYGSSARVALGALRLARQEKLKVGLLRPISLWPFPQARLKELAKKIDRFLVVEMSMGQMAEDVRLAVNGQADIQLHSRTGGGIPTSEDILRDVKRLLKKQP
jgi:2-oxoglutarate ferredoxin oxidoreductase subunit alpha